MTAMTASEIFDSSMEIQMHLETAFLCKGTLTALLRAMKWLSSCMSSIMLEEIMKASKGFSTCVSILIILTDENFAHSLFIKA